MWTRQRNETFVPVGQAMDAIRGVAEWREYEQCFESVVVQYGEEYALLT